MQTRSKTALCVIAKNKENIIKRMLESTQKVFDLYCLQDTGSTDNTIQEFENWCKENKVDYKIGQKEYKTVVVDGKKWLAEFNVARNDSFELAKGCKYAMWMDTDDIIENADKIPEVIELMDKDEYMLSLFRYDYATTKEGIKLVEQRRERLINIEVEGNWVGAVHEGYEFKTKDKLKALNIEGITIKHLRTPTEAKETGRRNNKILKLRESLVGFGKLKDKELWDLGYDHFEHKEIDEAIKYFEKLEKDHFSKQVEERKIDILTKLARLYFWNGEIEKSVGYCYKGLQMKEDAQIYLILGEIKSQLRDWEGLEYIGKKVLRLGKPQTTGAINESDFTVVPKRMILTALVSTGRFEEALKVLNEIMLELPNNPQLIDEFHKITHEIDRNEFIRSISRIKKYLGKVNEIKSTESILEMIPADLDDSELVRVIREEIKHDLARKQEKTILNGSKTIDFYVGGHLEEWNGESDIKNGIGGSEGMVIQMARELQSLGNQVTVYGENKGGEFDGVIYKNHTKWNPENDVDIFIGVRSAGIEAMNYLIKAKRQYLYLHDTHYGDIPQVNFNITDKVIVLSDFHKDIIKQRHGLLDDSIFYISRNAYNEVAMPKKMPKRNKNKIIYASSYDRGLDNLLRMWPEIKKRLPEVELDIYYGWDTFDGLAESRGSAQMKDFKKEMVELMKQDGITEHGRVDQKTLYKAFATANIWLYPTEFEEISCINAMTAQTLGAIPVCTSIGALKETVSKKYGVITELDNIVDACVHTYENYKETKRQNMMEWAGKKYNVKKLAEEWNNLLTN